MAQHRIAMRCCNTIWYHCTDTLFSTVAVLSDTGAHVERVSYDAYGMARHHHAADIEGDGAVTQDDYDLITANLASSIPSQRIWYTDSL